MDFIDYYKILGIDKSATADEIKKAYRKMARKYHPDLNPNDKEANIRFQQVNEANEVLTDPEKRKKYDKYGKDWQHGEQYEQARNQQQQYRQPGSETYSGGFGDSDFSDFFSSMFGGARGGRQTRYRGQDYEAAITLPFRDVYQTTKQTITINNKQVRITIPAGIEDRQRIKLAGYGSPGVNGGPAGDLFITINITADHRYIRKGNDLYVKEDISLYTAVLGGTHIVETLSGKVKVNLAAGTQNGDTARIKGKGFPAYKKEGQFGDLYVQWHIILPKTLSEEQKALFEKLAKT